MSGIYHVRSPHLLHIDSGGVTPYYGGNQAWYRKYWQRMAGCGPTSGAHLLWYLARTRPECLPLAPFDASARPGFLRLMEESWSYITPGLKGVNSTNLFVEGLARYGRDHGVPLSPVVLDINPPGKERPEEETVFEFLAGAFSQDVPVAFLNLDNGALANLEKWHWVTLVECDLEARTAVMYDQSRCSTIDLGIWLQTARAGGGFVTVLQE